MVKFPSEIMIEATNHCNNKCFFCGSTVSNRPRGFIDSKLCKNIIREAYRLGCRKISFHGMGEPFLHNDLAEFVSEAKSQGYKYIYLDTNGILAEKGRVERVLDAGLDSLKFSIHATNPETYYKITKNKAFEKVRDNAKYISNYIREKSLKCKTIAYCALSSINNKEIDEFKEMWGGTFLKYGFVRYITVLG